MFSQPLGRFVDLVHDAEMWVSIVSRGQYMPLKQYPGGESRKRSEAVKVDLSSELT